MTVIVTRANELLRRIRTSRSTNSARFRFFAQISNLRECTKAEHREGYVSRIVVQCLPEFQNGNDVEYISCLVSESLYQTRFLSPSIPAPAVGDPVDIRVGVWEGSSNTVLEALDIQVLSLSDVQQLREFLSSKIGIQFLQLSQD